MRWVNQSAVTAALLAASFLTVPAFGQEESDAAEVDFYRDVEPILSSHCFRCHGPEQQLGGLRLDDRTEAERGGYSGNSVRAPAENNELLKRITEDEPALRMPKDRPALSAAHITMLKKWVATGAPWPQRPKRIVPPTKVFGIIVPDWLVEKTERVDDTLTLHPFRRLLLCLFLFVNLSILLIERKKRAAISSATDQGTAPGRISHIGWRHYGTIYMLFAITLVLGISWGGWNDAAGRLQRAEQQLEETATRLAAATSTSIEAIFGNPPVPFRPSHAPTLSKVYYRGNCERSPGLFNNGFYRTAELEVTLVDAKDRRLQVGDVVSADGMAVLFRMRRSKGATPGHFTKGVIENICLSEKYFDPADDTRPEAELVYLSTVKEGEEWEAKYSISVAADDSNVHEGLIYVYYGSSPRTEGPFRGSPHYGIKYAVTVADGKIAEGSEIWMNFLFLTGKVRTPSENTFPSTEWFDHRPIPEIDGENSTDPKLLGLPE